ncbi:hypothetical protein ACROYT_G039551 [Oculina patagonica]
MYHSIFSSTLYGDKEHRYSLGFMIEINNDQESAAPVLAVFVLVSPDQSLSAELYCHRTGNHWICVRQ